MSKLQPNQRHLELAQKFLNGTISPEEELEYAEWYNTIDPDDVLEIPSHIATDSEQHRLKILQQIISRKAPVIPMYRKYLRQIVAAAILVLVTGVYLYFNNDNQPAPATVSSPVKELKNDIKPGTYGAILTLSSGKTILLDTARNGKLMPASGIDITKADKIVTIKAASSQNNIVEYYTLSTPRGRQQELVLPDGTAVWLNAQSSIKFPTVFSGSHRNVEVSGEAFFEVAKDISKSFIVHVNEAEIEVLGTHFNVMAYHNENALETTLLEGSVTFRMGANTVLLKPGQQSQLVNSEIKLVKHPDVEQVLAWKNGMQSFNSADIKTIMRQVERWYDVDVAYKGNITMRKFTGEIPRNVNLSHLLKLFEVNRIRFEIDAENKKITVMP